MDADRGVQLQRRLFQLIRSHGANMKLLVVLLALSTVPALAADMKVSGYISDSNCGAKHNSSAPDAACVKKCLDGGAKPVFVDDAKKEVYAIDDPDSVKGHDGHHVAVVGKVDESAKTIHISKLTMLKDQGTPSSTSEMH